MGPSQAQVKQVLLERAVDILPVGVTVADPCGRIIHTNSAEAEMHGFQVRELIGQDVGIFAPGNYRKQIEFSKRTRFERESVNVHRQGHVFPVRLISDVVLNNGGEPLGIITACEDMRRLQQSARDSQTFRIYNFHWHKMEALSELVRGVASDINNTLTGLMGYVDMIMKKFEKGYSIQSEYIQLQQLFEQMRLLILELYKFSHTSRLEMGRTNINEVIKKSQLALNAIAGPNINFRLRLGGNIWNILANENGLEQAIINLVLNAKAAMPDGGSIFIKTENIVLNEVALTSNPNSRLGEFVCISIIDTGGGIDKKTQGKIFEPFFTTRPMGQGLGLGLSVVHRNVELHNGWIEVFSLPGKGSAFKVYIPRH